MKQECSKSKSAKFNVVQRLAQQKHSLREGSRSWSDFKRILAVPYCFFVCGESFVGALLSPCIQLAVKTVTSRVAFGHASCRAPCFIRPLTERFYKKLLYSPEDGRLTT